LYLTRIERLRITCVAAIYTNSREVPSYEISNSNGTTAPGARSRGMLAFCERSAGFLSNIYVDRPIRGCVVLDEQQQLVSQWSSEFRLGDGRIYQRGAKFST